VKIVNGLPENFLPKEILDDFNEMRGLGIDLGDLIPGKILSGTGRFLSSQEEFEEAWKSYLAAGDKATNILSGSFGLSYDVFKKDLEILIKCSKIPNSDDGIYTLKNFEKRIVGWIRNFLTNNLPELRNIVANQHRGHEDLDLSLISGKDLALFRFGIFDKGTIDISNILKNLKLRLFLINTTGGRSPRTDPAPSDGKEGGLFVFNPASGMTFFDFLDYLIERAEVRLDEVRSEQEIKFSAPFYIDFLKEMVSSGD